MMAFLIREVNKMKFIETENMGIIYKGTIKLPFVELKVMVADKYKLRYINREDSMVLFNKLDVEVPESIKKAKEEYVLESVVRVPLFSEWLKFDNKKVELFMGAMSLVGFVSLIDEVTGYQEFRGDNELQYMFD